jgi:uncharacterized protein YxeA
VAPSRTGRSVSASGSKFTITKSGASKSKSGYQPKSQLTAYNKSGYTKSGYTKSGAPSAYTKSGYTRTSAIPYSKPGYASTYRPSPARTSRAPSKFKTYSPPKSVAGQSGYPATVGRSVTGQSALPGQSYGPGMTSQWGAISRSQNPYSGYGYDQEYAGEQPMYVDPSMYPAAPPQQEKKGCSTGCIIAIILAITLVIVGGAILIWYFCIRETTDEDKVDSGRDGNQSNTSQNDNDDNDNTRYKFQYEEFPGNRNFIDYGGSYQHKLESAYQKAKRSGSTEILNLNMGKVSGNGEGDFIVEVEFKGDRMTQHSMKYEAGQHFWNSGRHERSGKQRQVRRVPSSKRSGSSGSSGSSSGSKWEWNENGTWKAYSSGASRTIERKYQRNKRNAAFIMEAKTGGPTRSGGIDVKIELSGSSGTQTGLSGNQNTHNIRRK